MPSVSLVMVLIHGTRPQLFGRDLMAPPTWTRRDSPFRNILANALGEEPLFVEFEWSGTNAHAARLDAAARLADLLRQLRREHPIARLVVVAHSHGGNVALYAVRQLATTEGAAPHPVDGVVCLGTPFLSVALRDLEAVFRRLRVSLYWGAVFALMALIPILWVVFEQVSRKAAWVALGAGGIAFIIWKFGGARLLTRYFTEQKVAALKAEACGLAAAVDCRLVFKGPPILVVKSERDEAKLWLTLLDRSASLLSGERLLQWTSRAILAGAALFDWLERHGLTVVFSVTLVGALVMRALGAAEVKPTQVKLFLFAPAALLIALSLMHSLLFITIVLTLRGSTLAFGQSLFLSLVASVSARGDVADDNNPCVRVITLTLPLRIFHHASFYIDPPTIKAIGAWLDAARDTSVSPVR